MSKTTAAERNYHAKMYIDAVFAETLKQEGFVNPDGNSISWYRVVNKELVHAVYFHASRGAVPIFGMYIESLVFPLFQKPKFYSVIYTPASNRHIGYRTMPIKDIRNEFGGYTYTAYSKDILVYAYSTGKRGLYTLEVDVLPWFRKSMTLADYYQVAIKEFWDEPSDFYKQALLTDVVTLALFYGDEEKYPALIQWLEHFLPDYLNCTLMKDKYKQQRLSLKTALDGETRQAFMQQLEPQKAKTIQWLKKMGIPV